MEEIPAMRGRGQSEHEPALPADDDLPDVARGALERLRPPGPWGGPAPGKRGPKTAVSDAELLAAIRGILQRDALPRGGLPEGAGAAGPSRRGRQRQARPAADAAASAPGAAAARAAQLSSTML